MQATADFVHYDDANCFILLYFQCSRSCGGGTQVRDVMCLDHKGQSSKECHSRNKPYHYQRCNNTPCPTSAGQARRQPNCKDTYSGTVCMYVTQANFCQFSHYRRMCCRSCAKRHWHQVIDTHLQASPPYKYFIWLVTDIYVKTTVLEENWSYRRKHTGIHEKWSLKVILTLLIQKTSLPYYKPYVTQQPNTL